MIDFLSILNASFLVCSLHIALVLSLSLEDSSYVLLIAR